MSVFVKHKLFTFHNDSIRNISIQKEGSVLAFSGGLESDTLKILDMKIASEYSSPSVTEKISFAPINLTTNSKDSIYLMKWSPNDQYLATGCVKVKVWRYTNKNLFLVKDFSDHSLEITALSWSPDSTRLASSSLASKIVVRNIEVEGVKDIHLGSKVLGLVWDPLDKYLSCLTADNNIIVFKTNTWEQIKSVSLSFSANMVLSTCKREDRKIDWSPDFKYILSPSLDDKIVPMVCALDRQDFKVTHSFMGPFSSINCVKFNPHLFLYQKHTISVFAMGDNDGNISIWGLSERLVMNKPFFLFKSHYNGTELIEDLCWNGEGNLLLATTLKKYISLILFEEKVFGEKLKSLEKQRHLEEMYGVKNLITKTQTFKIFNPNQAPKETPANTNTNYATYMGLSTMDDQTSKPEEGLSEFNSKPEVKYVFTEQKTILENGRKRIIPQMQKIITEDPRQEKTPETVIKASEKQKTNDGEKPKTNNSKMVPEKVTIEIESDSEEKNLKKNKSPEPEGSDYFNKVFDVLDQNKTNSKESKSDKKPSEALGNSANQGNANILLKKKSPAVKENKKSGGNTSLESKQTSSNTARSETNLFNQPAPISGSFMYRYLAGKILELEVKTNNAKSITKVKCSIMKNNQKEILWTDFYEGKVLFLEFNDNIICSYTSDSNLYICSSKGRRIEIPLVVSNLGYLRLNKNDDVLLLKTTGELKVMNLRTKTTFVDENIRFIFLENSKDPKISAQQDIIENIVLDNFGIPIILFKNKSLYFYSKDHKSWQKTDFSEFELGYLQSISQLDFEIKNIVQTKQIEKIDRFFDKLFSEKEEESIREETEGEMRAIPFLEEKLLFFISKSDLAKFLEITQKYVDKLAQLKEINKLRQFLVDIIIETSSKEAQFLISNQVNRPDFYKKLIKSLTKYQHLEPLISELESFFITCL